MPIVPIGFDGSHVPGQVIGSRICVNNINKMIVFKVTTALMDVTNAVVVFSFGLMNYRHVLKKFLFKSQTQSVWACMRLIISYSYMTLAINLSTVKFYRMNQ